MCVFVRMFGDAFVVVVVYLVDNCDTFLVRTSPLNSTKIVVIVANQNSILNNMEWIDLNEKRNKTINIYREMHTSRSLS